MPRDEEIADLVRAEKHARRKMRILIDFPGVRDLVSEAAPFINNAVPLEIITNQVDVDYASRRAWMLRYRSRQEFIAGIRDVELATAGVAISIVGHRSWSADWSGLDEPGLTALIGVLEVIAAGIEGVAQALLAIGAPVDPVGLTDWVTLAQLILLPIDLSMPSTELVEKLNVPVPFVFSGDFRSLGSIRDSTARDIESGAIRLRSSLRSKMPDYQRMHDRGGRPTIESGTSGKVTKRREALRQVIEKYPDVTASVLRHDPVRDEAKLLMVLMQWKPYDIPSYRTLWEDLRQIKASGTP